LDGARFAFLEDLKQSPPQQAKKDRPAPATSFQQNGDYDGPDVSNEDPVRTSTFEDGDIPF
jgi:hypothetical protein